MIQTEANLYQVKERLGDKSLGSTSEKNRLADDFYAALLTVQNAANL